MPGRAADAREAPFLPSGPSARERNILVVTSTAHYLAHLSILVFPSLALTLRTTFGLPLEQVLALSFWMYLLFGLGALPAGILTDLLQPRLMLTVCLLGMGGSALLAARAGSTGELRLALAGLGLFASIYHPAGMALISRGVRRRGWALGVNGVWGNLGDVTAPFLAGFLAVTLGWRAPYLLVGLVAVAGGVLTLRLPVATGPAGGGDPAPARRAGGGGRRRTVLAFSLLCVAMALGGIAYRGQTLVLPAYFEERIGFLVEAIGRLDWLPRTGTRTVAATFLVSLAYLAGAAGQVVGGHLADRIDLRKAYLLFHGLALPLLLGMGFAAGWPLLALAVGYAFFAFGMQPIENSLVAALTPDRLRSTGYGLKFILTFGVGSLAVQLVGVWEEHGGLAAVFPWLAGAVALLLVFAGLLWWVTRRRELQNRPRAAEAPPR